MGGVSWLAAQRVFCLSGEEGATGGCLVVVSGCGASDALWSVLVRCGLVHNLSI